MIDTTNPTQALFDLLEGPIYPSQHQLRLALKNEIDFSARDQDGRTPLLQALRRQCDLIIIKQLVERGSDINAQDAQGNTALHLIAPSKNSARTLQYLLDQGADPSARNHRGDTPLMAACYWPHSFDNENDTPLAEHPLTPLTARNLNGHNALDIVLNGYTRMANRLVQHGLAISPKDTLPSNLQSLRDHALKAWDNFCATTDHSSITLEDLHLFSNIDKLGEALNPQHWQGQLNQLHRLIGQLHPGLLEHALSQSPGLVHHLNQPPGTQISRWNIDPSRPTQEPAR